MLTAMHSVQSRDLLSIYSKLIQVLYPRRTGVGREVLRLVRKEHLEFTVQN